MNNEWHIFWAVISISLWAHILFRKEGMDNSGFEKPPSEEERIKLQKEDLIEKMRNEQ